MRLCAGLMRPLAAILLLILACFLGFVSIPMAIAAAAAGVALGQRVTARDEDRFVGLLAPAHVCGGFGLNFYQRGR